MKNIWKFIICVLPFILYGCMQPAKPSISLLYLTEQQFPPTDHVDMSPLVNYIELGQIDVTTEDREEDWFGIPVTVSGGDPVDFLKEKAKKIGANAIIIIDTERIVHKDVTINKVKAKAVRYK